MKGLLSYFNIFVWILHLFAGKQETGQREKNALIEAYIRLYNKV